MRVDLPYGRTPYTLDLGDREAEVLRTGERPAPRPVETLLEQALSSHPVGRFDGARVTLVISDPARSEPRAAFVEAVRRRLPNARLTIAVATGTHGPARLAELGIPAPLLEDTTIVNHDGHRDEDLIELGTTPGGTPVRVHRCVVDADLVVATGCIRPHYFAGFGAGVKAIFPGLGQAAAIRINHRLKVHPRARAGIVDGNPCREDLEDAVALLKTPTLLLNGVCGPDGQVHEIVIGDLVTTFREGVALARPWFTVATRPAALVIASDPLPVSASLYQAAKIAAAAAPFLEPQGVLVIVAECADGVGPLEIVNEAIFRIGVVPRLPQGAKLVLISGRPREEVDRTLLEYARSVDPYLPATGRILVLPRASHLLYEAPS